MRVLRASKNISIVGEFNDDCINIMIDIVVIIAFFGPPFQALL